MDYYLKQNYLSRTLQVNRVSFFSDSRYLTSAIDSNTDVILRLSGIIIKKNCWKKRMLFAGQHGLYVAPIVRVHLLIEHVVKLI